jgi:hypothetical protein
MMLKNKTKRRDRRVLVPAQPHPLAEFVGMFKDDPLIKKWKESMKAHRRKRDKDADKP